MTSTLYHVPYICSVYRFYEVSEYGGLRTLYEVRMEARQVDCCAVLFCADPGDWNTETPQ